MLSRVTGDLCGSQRKHLVVIQVDGFHRIPAFAPLLKHALEAAAKAGGAVGVGVASMLGFDATSRCLRVSMHFQTMLWCGYSLLRLRQI